jgi:hypothetical protein
MDMNARNQYLRVLQESYFQARSRKEKSSILDEYCRNTGHNRKYLIRRINSSIPSTPKRKRRREVYDGYVRAALAEVWEIFDCPCGQRLAPLLEAEVDRLRDMGELLIPDEVAEKLKRISPRTIDRKLEHQKEFLHQKRRYHRKNNPLIYQKIPIRTSWDRCLIGQEEIDLVSHCGASASGEYINSVSVVDIATGWWEGEGIMGKGQERTFKALTSIRERTPFDWLEVHPDNDTAFINGHLLRYTQQEGIEFSRSRPYKKNDNCFVEQKNSTHIRGFLGHLRYDTHSELEIINELYRKELRLYKNFFQPVMKLKEKIRDKGKVHRKYHIPKTPYQTLMESEQISEEIKKELQNVYHSLNPAELKRGIDEKINNLFKAYAEKGRGNQLSPFKKQTARTNTKRALLQKV